MNFTLPLLAAMLPVTGMAQAQTQSAAPKLPPNAIPTPTAVLVLETPREGVTFAQVMEAIPAEIRATVQLYLQGKIREWYSRGDGRGVVFLLDAKTEEEARTIMETLPFAKAKLMDTEYIPVGPLVPLRALLNAVPQQ